MLFLSSRLFAFIEPFIWNHTVRILETVLFTELGVCGGAALVEAGVLIAENEPDIDVGELLFDEQMLVT
jgi:hypothetical protein